MSDHISGNKSNIYEKDWLKFDQENFILDCFSVDWENFLKINLLNADNSTQMLLNKINSLLINKLINKSWNSSLNLGQP